MALARLVDSTRVMARAKHCRFSPIRPSNSSRVAGAQTEIRNGVSNQSTVPIFYEAPDPLIRTFERWIGMYRYPTTELRLVWQGVYILVNLM
jgi:hypothetical protein